MYRVAGESVSTGTESTSVARCGAVVGSWYEGLNGQRSLKDPLGELCKYLGAEACLISRVQLDGTSPPKTVSFDKAEHEPTIPNVQTSYCNNLLGAHKASVKVGSIWCASEFDNRLDFHPRFLDVQRKRGFQDFMVLILSNKLGQLDLIEAHSIDQFCSKRIGDLATIAPLITRAWQHRRSGTVSLAISKRPPTVEAVELDVPILSSANSFGLSRCEYRVCHLMKSGLMPNLLAEELGKSKATIRSHLRSIYAKTGARNQTELLFRLMAYEEVTTATETAVMRSA